jgi:hypothetical protein
MDPLTSLGMKYGTDKVSHGFCFFYHYQLVEVREAIRKVLEIGIFRGSSIQMWREYFPNAVIHGFDVLHYSVQVPDRVCLHQGDQTSRESLRQLLDATGSDFDLVIDDGGHTMEQQQVSLGFLFPHVRPGGMYIVEDLHSSFMSEIFYSWDGQTSGKYSTGAEDCLSTTYDLIEALRRGEPVRSNHMTAGEIDYLTAHVESAEVFDRDRDRQHITSLLRKRGEKG